jgi:hypothetical protein
MQLLDPQFRVFEPRDVLLALDHIGVARSRFDPIWRVLVFLQVGMSLVMALRAIASELSLPLEYDRRSLVPSSRPPPR